jgi:predicted nucleic acid-binding protein
LITASDTNVLLDILFPDSPFYESSEQALLEASDAGLIVISEPVLAEVASRFAEETDLHRFLTETGVRYEPSTMQSLIFAGRVWRRYAARRPRLLACPRCGAGHELNCRECGVSIAPRQHIVADFIIGAHASLQADRFVTRDRGYYRTYFPNLAFG